MRKHDQRVRKLLGGQEGSMAPLAVAAAIAMLIIILGVSEYMRLVITAAGKGCPGICSYCGGK